MKSFSVVLATSAGRAETLKRCLESVFAGDYPPDFFEVIVIDSGGGEACLAVVEGFKKERENLRFYSPGWGNVGPAKARNLGIKKAKNEIVAFTDDDCAVPADWLQRLNSGYERYPEVVGVGGYLEAPAETLSKNVFAQYEKFHERTQYGVSGQEFLSTKRDEAPFETNNISYKREVLEKVEGFDENFPTVPLFVPGEDGDLKERVVALGYSLLFLPLKVTHLQDYGLKRFWNQQMSRGAGISVTKKKKGMRLESGWELGLKTFLVPALFFRFLVKDGFKIRFAILDTVAFLSRQVGKFVFLFSKVS